MRQGAGPIDDLGGKAASILDEDADWCMGVERGDAVSLELASWKGVELVGDEVDSGGNNDVGWTEGSGLMEIEGWRAEEDQGSDTKVPFGYTRKDVLLIGVGLTVLGVGLKSGLEFIGVDPLQAGNVVQLVLVLGLTVGWISTYIFRVSNKEMTYAQQLRAYENKVMEVSRATYNLDIIIVSLYQVVAEARKIFLSLVIFGQSCRRFFI
ncbi:hypothetical protein KSP39_PZI018136 [Platanthera zijinensis]|uniref:Uncharacterized protein n=1 Tax=Platanthera zijinensis TaxID=2320716 RepID=A0AAP0B3G8_9ASPA